MADKKSAALAVRRPGRVRISGWDRFLISIAPRWGLGRVRARAAVGNLARHYDATGHGRRTSGWYRRSTDANAAAANSITGLRELSRDLRRNNGWARRGIQAITNNTVGWGIQAKPIGVDQALAAKALELWNAWAGTSRCDWDGRMPFAGLQRLVMETVVESGEALVVRQPAGSRDELPIPMRIQVLEPDYLDGHRDTYTDVPTGNRIEQGIEFDKTGHRVAYWLFETHPGASFRVAGARMMSRRVPASEVLHIFQIERPGQRRGVPWLASAIARLNDFDDYEDASLMQQKIAACFGAFVQDDGASSPAGSLGEQDPDDPVLETLEPGHIEYLAPGKTVSFAQPPTVNDTTFTTRNLRRIAASLGVTYEDLTGDYSQVNFSSARMGRLAHYANVHDWRWNMIVPQLCDGVWAWAMEYAAALSGWSATPTAEWAPPPMPMIDPEKEGIAYQRLIRAGMMTLYGAMRERGEDPEATLTEIAAGNKRLDELAIVLDSDPRRVSAAGLVQVASGGADPAAAGAKTE